MVAQADHKKGCKFLTYSLSCDQAALPPLYDPLFYLPLGEKGTRNTEVLRKNQRFFLKGRIYLQTKSLPKASITQSVLIKQKSTDALTAW